MPVARIGLLGSLAWICVAVPLSAVPASAQSAKRNSFLLVATGEQGWDSNALYVADSVRTSDFIRRINATIQATKVTARGTVSLLAGGSALFYDKLRPLNTLTYNFATAGTYRLGARTNAIASANYGNQLVGEVRGSAANPLLRRALQRTIGGVVSADYRLSPFVTAAAGAAYSRVTFDSPGLIPGTNLNGVGSLKRRLRTRGSIGLLADVSHGIALGTPLETQTLAADWQPLVRALGSVRFAVRAGVTRSVADTFSAKFSPTGSLSVSDTIGRGLLAVVATRAVSQGYGLGALLVTTAEGASYTFEAKRGNLVTLDAFNSQSTATGGPTGAALKLRAQGVGGTVRRVFKQGIAIGGGASYRSRRDFVRATGVLIQLQAGFAFGAR